MKCSGCGFENPAQMKFCGGCGESLPLLCPACEQPNPARHTFCGHCGAALDGSTPPGAETEKPARTEETPPRYAIAGEAEGERRHMTVMFCDLVGSTELSELLDPEDLRDLFTLYQEIADGAVKKYDGYIAKFLGDGILVYFGYPRAHEDDAVRAVKAGMDLFERLPKLNEKLQTDWAAGNAVSAQVRIGIHTGLVVVGDMATESFREQDAIVGQAPNVAARIQSAAEPNTIVVSADTHRLIQSYFDCVSLGEQRLRGLSKPVEVYQIGDDISLASQDELSLRRAPTKLIGREQEAKILLDRWQRAESGQGQVVTICGEAGIGKSRLTLFLREQLANAAHTRLRCQCSPYFNDSALHPLKELLSNVFRFDREDSEETKHRKLEEALDRHDASDDTHIFARLLNVPLRDGGGLSDDSPERVRKETLRAVTDLLLGIAGERPLLLFVEDLHWVDASTLELIRQLTVEAPKNPLMMVMTYRPDFEPPWSQDDGVVHLDLERLSPEQTRSLIRELTGGRALPREMMAQILEKTDGVPLFIEELTKMVLESDMIEERNGQYVLSGALLELSIPDTLQESLMARLDRLAVDKTITQIGAAIGRTFSYELMAGLVPMDEVQLQDELQKLVDAEVFFQRGIPPYAEYIFKHAMIQETAYHSLLRSTRQKYHQHIASVLKERFPDIAGSQPEVMAKHFTEAGMYPEAVRHWQKAGLQALAQSAHVEAVSHFKRGIDLLHALEDSPERANAELMLQASLGNALMSTRGYGSADVERAYTKAWQLCQKVDAAPRILLVRFGLWGFYLLRGDVASAEKLAHECHAQAKQAGVGYIAEQANFALGMTYFWKGELARGRRYLEAAIEHYDEEYRRSRIPPAVQDPAVASRSILAMTLWLQGEREAGLEMADAALALAEKISHAFTTSFALSFAALLYQLEGDVQRTFDLSRQGISLSAEQGFSFYLAICVAIEGWAICRHGERRRGVERIKEGVQEFRESGANLGAPYFDALLGVERFEHGQSEEARQCLERAERDMLTHGGSYYHAEVYRMQAEIALRDSPATPWNAEERLRKAIDVATEQGAGALLRRAEKRLAEISGGPVRAQIGDG